MKWDDCVKKKMILGGLAFILLGGVVFGCYKFYESKELDVDIVKRVTAELNDKVYNTDGVKSIENGRIVDKKEVINTDKVGVKKIILNVSICPVFIIEKILIQIINALLTIKYINGKIMK